MRIGTWNLAGRWDARHRTLLETMDCDALLLTEVSERLKLQVPTASSPHQIKDLLSIDHIAVPQVWVAEPHNGIGPSSGRPAFPTTTRMSWRPRLRITEGR